jgi:hypothetical protein
LAIFVMQVKPKISMRHDITSEFIIIEDISRSERQPTNKNGYLGEEVSGGTPISF